MKRTDSPFFTPEQIKLIREHILDGAPEFEIERFIITCERTELDCFSRQIYGHVQNKKVRHNGKEVWVPTVVIITSIDGFRAIAERSGQYRGQTKPEWYYVDENGISGWHDVFITSRDRNGNPMKVPDACRVGIIREGFAEPCYGVANFSSFAKYYKSEGEGYQLETFWKKMPEHMIAKIAEAQGHRKAFPLLACGLYVEEEVRDTEDEAPAQPHAPEPLPADMTPVGRTVAAPPVQPPAAPEAPKAPAAPETAAPPAEPAPEKKARAKKQPAVESEPVTPPPAAPAAKPQDAAPGGEPELPLGDAWQDYTISQITITKFQGKKLSEIAPEDIATLYTGWVQKYAEKIKLNPAKVREAEMLTAAYEKIYGS